MKVLLINPYVVHPFPSPYLPLGVGYLAAFLKQQGIEVQVLDLANNRMGLGALEDFLLKNRPDIIGVSVKYANLRSARRIAQITRRVLPESLIVFGGSWPTSTPEEILKGIPELDACVRNEGELTLLEIVERRAQGRDLLGVDGVSYRDGEGRIRHNRVRELIEDLNCMPSPFLTDGIYDLSRYKVGSLITARGCYMKCLFCSAREIFLNRWRRYDPERIIEEARRLYAAGLREFVFFDDTFSVDEKQTREVLAAFRREMPGAALQCNARFDRVNPDLLAEMKAAGFYILNLGLETAVDETLEMIGKGITPAGVRKAHRWIKDAGIKTLINLIVGLPGDDRAAILRTFEFAKSLEADVYTIHVLRPFPNTDLYRDSVKYGLSYATGESMYLRRADTDQLTYEEMRELMDHAGKYFEMGDFYNKILRAERIDIFDVHPARTLMG